MDVAILVDILSVLLIIVSFLFLGKTYFVGALFSSICYMSLFSIFHWTGWEMPMPELFGTPILGNADRRIFRRCRILFLHRVSGDSRQL